MGRVIGIGALTLPARIRDLVFLERLSPDDDFALCAAGQKEFER